MTALLDTHILIWWLDQSARLSPAQQDLKLIGEAAARIPSEVRESHDAIPWRDIVAMHNHLAVGYTGLNDDTVWQVIEDKVPDLLVVLRIVAAKTRGP